MALDRTTLHAIADLADETGVLSVYVTADPRAESAVRPAWQVRIRNELVSLRDRLTDGGDRRRLDALTARLAELEPAFDWLLDPKTPGLGRALFAPLRGGDVRTLSVQVPLGDLVELQPVAFLRPLIAAWGDGEPAGIAAVSTSGLRVVDYRFGLARDVADLRYEETAENRRELKGPGAANPAMAQHSAPQRDLYARRRADRLARFLRTTGERLGALAGEFDWSFVVLTGDADILADVADGLPRELGVDVVRASHVVGAMTAPQIAASVAGELTAARADRARRLAEQARDAALSGQAGAYGLGDTLSALAEGRIAHLLLDRAGEWRGHRAPDGRLSAADEVVPGVAPDALVDEPQLAERMIESVLRQGGEVTLLDGDAAGPLADAGGVGAILRW